MYPNGKILREYLTPESFGQIVRAYRKAQGLRQAELAGVSGVGVRFIVDLEAGRTTIHLGKALHVLATLGCQMEIRQP